MLAAIHLDFDPTSNALGLSIRLETLALAGVIFLVLLLIGLNSGRLGRDGGIQDDPANAVRTLRRDDLILMAFGALPGAIVGARLGYALIHWDFYSADIGAIADPAQGGLGLTLAVVGGLVAAVSVARLLAVPVGRWLAVATVPVLIGLGLGKLAMALGGSGQGAFSDASWATSYAGQGPWGSLNADSPAVPSQILEGALVLAVAVLILVFPFLLRLRLRKWGSIVRPGLDPRREWSALSGARRALTALGLWALVRFAAAFTWRDAHVLGPLGADQLVLLVVAVVAFGGPPFAGWLRLLRNGVTGRLASRRVRRAEQAARQREEAAARANEAAATAAAAADAEAAAVRAADTGAETTTEPSAYTSGEAHPEAATTE